MELGEQIQLDIVPDYPTSYPTLVDLVGRSNEFAKDIIQGVCHSNIYERFSVLPNKSYVLNGAPGTGKTFSVKAVNNTLNGNIDDKLKSMGLPKNRHDDVDVYNVAVISYDIGSYGTAYINRGSRIIQQFFDYIYNLSYGIPVIIKLDEADALLLSRNLDIHAEDRKNLETLMKNLQIAHDVPNVYVVMMTNRLVDMDQATYRAGRVDKCYTFNLPDLNERRILFDKIINKYNTHAEYEVIRQYDTEQLAKLTEGFSHADISSVIEKSLRLKVANIIGGIEEYHIDKMGYITEKGIEEAIEEHKRDFIRDKRQSLGFALE